jgi:hypothetical protein
MLIFQKCLFQFGEQPEPFFVQQRSDQVYSQVRGASWEEKPKILKVIVSLLEMIIFKETE